MVEWSESGVKPKEGRVEQNTAVTGALTADAKCIGEESFTKFICAFFMSAAEVSRLILPARL
jgi:hypothetical protein